MTNDKQVAECFNKFFPNVGEELANKFEEDDVEQVHYTSKVTPTLSDLNLTGKQFTEKLKMLNPKKAVGHDGIRTNELRALADDMGVCLANICRQGYLEGKFPSTWKIDKLKPAYKGGERVERGHYHPLTMLPIASKVSEAVVFIN